MKISMIVAMSSNRVIGINNQLPWRLSSDMVWFKKQTMNKILLLGRKTWESLPIRPLPGREHIIISQNTNYQPLSVSGEVTNSVKIANSVENALKIAHNITKNSISINKVKQNSINENLEINETELMVIGGATIYQLMLPLCDRLYITQIKENFSGDAWFPEFDESKWHDVFNESHIADEKNHYDYEFIIKEKLHSK
jgi:dihydrofolate reductase